MAKWSQAKAASEANSGDWHDPALDNDVVDDVVDDGVVDEW